MLSSCSKERERFAKQVERESVRECAKEAAAAGKSLSTESRLTQIWLASQAIKSCLQAI